jgi:hypothetical protein
MCVVCQKTGEGTYLLEMEVCFPSYENSNWRTYMTLSFLKTKSHDKKID